MSRKQPPGGSDDGDRPYEVGRGKPPRNSQFKKGQSGNPAGRPKGSGKSASLQQALNKLVKITGPDGVNRKMTKLTLLYDVLVNMGCKGDMRAMEMIMRFLRPETGTGMTPVIYDGHVIEIVDPPLEQRLRAEEIARELEQRNANKPLPRNPQHKFHQ